MLMMPSCDLGVMVLGSVPYGTLLLRLYGTVILCPISALVIAII